MLSPHMSFMKNSNLIGLCVASSISSLRPLSNVVSENWKKIDRLRPPKNFVSRLSFEEKKQVEKVLKEVQLFVWLSERSPSRISIDQWIELLKICKVHSRIKFLFKLAEESVVETKSDGETVSKGSSGGYGDAPLDIDPLRCLKRKQLLKGTRTLKTIRLNVKPQILLDLRYYGNLGSNETEIIGSDVNSAIKTNSAYAEPFLITVTNFPSSSFSGEQFLRYSGLTNPFFHHFSSTYFVTDDVRTLYPHKNDFVYITSYAENIIDGPLNKNAYVLSCASHPRIEQSFHFSHGKMFNCKRLPFAKGQFVPLSAALQIFNEVYLNNGDWDSAVFKTAENRSGDLKSGKDRQDTYLQMDQRAKKERQMQVQQLMEMIINAVDDIP